MSLAALVHAARSIFLQSELAVHAGVAQAAALREAGAGLAFVRNAGAGALAELAALCLERLLALGRSVAAAARYGRPTDDGIAWPHALDAKAMLLRTEVSAFCPCSAPWAMHML